VEAEVVFKRDAEGTVTGFDYKLFQGFEAKRIAVAAAMPDPCR
jgi:hypothetical protein